MRTAQELADTSVPGLADFVSVDLLEAAVRGEELNADAVKGRVQLRRAGFRSVEQGSADAPYPVGDTTVLHPDMVQARCLVEGLSVLVRGADTDGRPDMDARVKLKMRELGVHSLMVVPLQARGITLGVASFGRAPTSQRYDEGDLALAEEVCSRAALCVDNARRYTREHTTALALQRSLLPHDLPGYLAVETAHRYVPAAAHAGAGGDWYDVLPLSGARVGLVVGDVMGHDLHAAAIMGRLRTAVHTLAALDLDPDEVLTQLDDLVLRLIQEDPDCLGATCLYAVYDPVSRVCVFARAGHPPPALVQPDGAVEFLHDIPSNLPLGVGGLPFETIERQLPEGAVLALYTDGLVEDLGRDIDKGLDRLAHVLAGSDGSLEQLCQAMVAVTAEPRVDDVALLLARTRALEADRVVSWELPADPALVAEARALVDRRLLAWDLEPLSFTTELIVSELVTNAIRHACGPIALRLVYAETLVCEVSDGSLSAPHLRRARTNEEGGRGLFLVAQVGSRWGTRYGRAGKTVWVEQALPGPDAAGDHARHRPD
ncbi:SpoIIE family protein phosphatase [Streptomyces sp. NBC_01261]|uniref:ATP-binding SpoIIE family protein phosphatase n=1 Tax=Streptomyces sp. NBC_01261 TaxID=2903802 RepID=UPI002E2FE17E|nr:SpoIIE family protein phosphatase [Streptomyces sp. NBC_01261]